MNYITVGQYAEATKIYPQLVRKRLEVWLKRDQVVLGPDAIVRGKRVVTFRFRDESKMPETLATNSQSRSYVPVKFFSDPFNKTGWHSA